jgi:hypothetical protein
LNLFLAKKKDELVTFDLLVLLNYMTATISEDAQNKTELIEYLSVII